MCMCCAQLGGDGVWNNDDMIIWTIRQYAAGKDRITINHHRDFFAIISQPFRDVALYLALGSEYVCYIVMCCICAFVCPSRDSLSDAPPNDMWRIGIYDRKAYSFRMLI